MRAQDPSHERSSGNAQSRFLLRATGLLLIGGGIAVGALYPRWGLGAVALVPWAMLCALGLGVVGFRSMLRGLQYLPSDSTQVATVLLVGLLVRLVVLVATQSVVFLGWGREWGVRSLLTTTLFYLLVLGTEVFSLARELGIFRPASRSPGESPSREGVRS